MICCTIIMEKRGSVGWIILSVVAIVLLVFIFAGAYFYNYHVFKTMRICLGDGMNTNYPCNTSQNCIDVLTNGDDFFPDSNDTPEFLKEQTSRILNEAMYCDNTCFLKNIRGMNEMMDGADALDFCEENETEILFEIRGKDGIEIMRYLRKKG